MWIGVGSKAKQFLHHHMIRTPAFSRKGIIYELVAGRGGEGRGGGMLCVWQAGSGNCSWDVSFWRKVSPGLKHTTRPALQLSSPRALLFK